MSSKPENPYLGYSIYQLVPSSDEDIKTIQDLDEERNDGVIFLTRSFTSSIGKSTDVMVTPDRKEEFIVKLTARGIVPKVVAKVCNDS